MSDDITEAVRADLLKRAELGLNKYGVTVGNSPIPTLDWLQHAYEECLDQAVYLKRAIRDLKARE